MLKRARLDYALNDFATVCRCTSNLALVLRDQGKYEQAEEMYRQALGLIETVLGIFDELRLTF